MEVSKLSPIIGDADAARRVAAHFAAMPNIREARPVKVSITYKGKTEIYFGMRYLDVGHYRSDMMACTNGDKKPGDEYTSDRFYLLADKTPASYKPKVREAGCWVQKILYRVPGDGCDWYVSSYMDQPITPEIAQYHPFGPTFMLGKWDHQDPIDQYGPRRERLPIQVEYLDGEQE